MHKSIAVAHLLLQEKSRGEFVDPKNPELVINLEYVDERIAYANEKLVGIYSHPVIRGRDMYMWRWESEAWNSLRQEILWQQRSE